MTAGHDDDAALLHELAALLREQNEPPPEVQNAAREIFTWRNVDAEIAALTYDSLLDDAPSAVRAAAQPRILTFEVAALTIEMEIDSSPSGRRLLGQIVPPQAAELELRHDGEVVGTAAADQLGRFSLSLPSSSSRFSVRCQLDGGVQVESAPALI